jgi:hypothetical protein
MAHRDRARPPAMVAAMRYVRPDRGDVKDRISVIKPTSLVVMCMIRSTGARSLGKGKRFCTSSRMESPVDHTSAQIVYSLPVIRSG